MGTLPTDAINLAHALHEMQTVLASSQSQKAKIHALMLLFLDEDLNRRLDRILPELRK